jgi:hypothetical protein
MTKEQLAKLNLAEGYAFGTFQSFKKDLGKKSGKPYGRVGILIGKTVHEFFDNVPAGVSLDAYKGPSLAVGQLMVISQPEFVVQNGRLNAGCAKFEPVTDK